MPMKMTNCKLTSACLRTSGMCWFATHHRGRGKRDRFRTGATKTCLQKRTKEGPKQPSLSLFFPDFACGVQHVEKKIEYMQQQSS